LDSPFKHITEDGDWGFGSATQLGRKVISAQAAVAVEDVGKSRVPNFLEQLGGNLT